LVAAQADTDNVDDGVAATEESDDDVDDDDTDDACRWRRSMLQ
jgi:hypothetical protein